MRIICKENTAKNLDLTEVTNILSHETKFYLTLEKEFIVMGVMINKYSPCSYYLIDDGDGRPDRYPYSLFEVSDPKIPDNWHIKIFDKKTPGDIHFLSGFYELVCDEDFYGNLIERDYETMRIYFRRKIEAEKVAAEEDLLASLQKYLV